MLKRFLMYTFFAFIAGFLISAIIYAYWYFNRSFPESINNEVLFEGTIYTRVVNQDLPLVYHIVQIDLNTSGISFLTTPRDDIDGFDYVARTTGQFLEEHHLQLAINGDFFDPWRDNGPFDYYPHVGDGVNIRGLTISQGQVAAEGYVPPETYTTLYIDSQNHVALEPLEDTQTAISGNVLIVKNGEYAISEDNPYLLNRHPRTAIAIDESGESLFLIVVDGRQPNYSRSVNMEELANIIIEAGGYNALNLDGGGSSSLLIEGQDGRAELLNSSIHTHIPYRERPIANHFGVYAANLDE